MRRSVLSAVIAAGLSLVACSDQPTEAGPGAIAPPPAAVTTSTCSEPVTSPSEIRDKIDQLFPSGPLRNSAQSQFKSIPAKTTKTTGTAARDKTFALIDFILKNYYAGKLIDLTPLTTYDEVLQLITALQCYVGLAPTTFPTTTAGSDIVVKVLFPNVAFDFSTPGGHAGLRGGAGAVTSAMGPVITTISDLPDEPPPLRTSLDQYPRFYLFHGTTATGAAVVFNEDVIAATCLRDGFFFGSTGNLRLAHNVGPNFGDVEVLPRSTVIPTGVTCPDEIVSAGGGAEGSFAWARKLFLPAELHATSTALVEVPVGGTTKKFSEFGIVDITSNPAPLTRNPNDATFSGLTAQPGGTVTPPSVRLTSQKGDPIPLWPVVFTVTGGGGTLNGDVLTTVTVLTGVDGTASVSSWKLGAEPGVNTVSATPTPVAQSPAEPGATQAFTPAGVSLPASLTFTATASSPLILTFGGGSNGQTGPANQILTAPIQVLASNGAEPVEGVVISFSVSEGSIPASATTNADGLVEVLWTLGPTVGSQTGTVSADGADDLILSATATAPPLVRAVLEWGEAPPDLDFHLTGPTAAGSRFHVYYGSPGSLTSAPFASLDRDDTSSFGPETITVNQVSEGTYRFSVHNYSNRFATSSDVLSLSSAKVTVYLASGASQVFNVPAQPGTLWTVFELSGTTITSVNQMSYESEPSDITAFSIFGRTASVMQSDATVIRDATERHPK